MGQVAGALLLNFGKQNSYALLGAGSPDPLSLSLGRLLSFRNFLEPPARIISIFVMRAPLSALDSPKNYSGKFEAGHPEDGLKKRHFCYDEGMINTDALSFLGELRFLWIAVVMPFCIQKGIFNEKEK